MGEALFFHEYGDWEYNVRPEDWNKLKHITCAFTGHRPQHFTFGFNEGAPECKAIKYKLMLEIERAIEDGYRIFISGGAIGVDTWAALNVIECKKLYPFIRLELALPCIGQESRWGKKDKEIYASLIDSSDSVIRTSRQPYYNGCMRIRNSFMIKRASRLITVFSGKPGGTAQTVEMAREKGLDIRLIEP